MNIVSNASPLICLSKANLLHILPELYRKIVVPVGVMKEIEAGQNKNDKLINFKQLKWIKIVLAKPPLSPIAKWQLGIGESEVIEWARLHKPSVALLAALLARRAAKNLGIKIQGTPGTIAIAYQRKIIPSFRNAIEKLKKSGLYFDEKVVEKVLNEIKKLAEKG